MQDFWGYSRLHPDLVQRIVFKDERIVLIKENLIPFQGTVARVRIGQPLMSVRTYDRHKGSVIEALRRTKFKFPGRQKVKRIILTGFFVYFMNLPFSLLYHQWSAVYAKPFF